MTRVLTALALTAGLLSPVAAAAQAPSLKNPASLNEKAPATYKVQARHQRRPGRDPGDAATGRRSAPIGSTTS